MYADLRMLFVTVLLVSSNLTLFQFSRLSDTEAEAEADFEFFAGSAPVPTMQKLRQAASFVDPSAVIAIAAAKYHHQDS